MKKIILWMAFPLALWSSCGTKEETATGTPEKRGEKEPAGAAYGIDISVWEGDVEKLLPQNDSLTFVICKATEGTDEEDAAFEENWKEIKTLKLIRGAYHFYHCDESAHAQVVFFLSVLDSLLPNDLPPIVDIEEFGMQPCQPSQQLQDSLLSFLQEVQSRTKRIPIVYTDAYTGNQYLSNPAFAAYPLYIADWNVASPALPTAWQNKAWSLWQKTNTYPLQPGGDDLDVFNGDVQALKKFIREH